MLLARTGCLVGALAIGTPASAAAQSSPDPSLFAIERAYYAGEPAAGREALEALGEADDVSRGEVSSLLNALGIWLPRSGWC